MTDSPHNFLYGVFVGELPEGDPLAGKALTSQNITKSSRVLVRTIIFLLEGQADHKTAIGQTPSVKAASYIASIIPEIIGNLSFDHGCAILEMAIKMIKARQTDQAKNRGLA